MAQFAVADIVIVVVVLVSAMFGMLRGLVREVASLLIWAAAFVLGLAFGPTLGALIAEDLGARPQTALGFGATFVVVLVAGAIVQRLLRGLIQSTGLSGTDRTLGLVFGGARGVAVVVLSLVALQAFAADGEWWQESQLAGPLLALESDVLAIVTAVKDALQGLVGGDAADTGAPI